MSKTTLQRRVNAQMTMLNLDQREVVARSGLYQSTVSRVQSGHVKKLDMVFIFKLADALECDPRWLALGEGTPDRK